MRLCRCDHRGYFPVIDAHRLFHQDVLSRLSRFDHPRKVRGLMVAMYTAWIASSASSASYEPCTTGIENCSAKVRARFWSRLATAAALPVLEKRSALQNTRAICPGPMIPR
jgi:hypothetical protein